MLFLSFSFVSYSLLQTYTASLNILRALEHRFLLKNKKKIKNLLEILGYFNDGNGNGTI